MANGDHLVKGINFFWQGIKLIFSQGFKRFIILPIIINFCLLFGLIYFLARTVSHSFDAWIASYPHWLTLLLGWLLWIIFWASSLFVSTFIFTVVTNIIASPFYGLLAEKTEKQLSSVIVVSNISIWKVLPHTLYREGQKVLYFIPWFLVCLLLFIFPLTVPMAPFAWWLVLTWLLAIQYIDYCADNQHISFKEMVKLLKSAPFTILGFGGTVTFFMLIPGANLIVPPAAVVGGTALWLSLKNRLN